MISVIINYDTLPFGLRRPRVTTYPATYPQDMRYGPIALWNRTGDWAHSGMAWHNLYWNKAEYINDWASGDLNDETLVAVAQNPEDWFWCAGCGEASGKTDQDGMIHRKDFFDLDNHPGYDPTDADHYCPIAIADRTSLSRAFANQMEIFWPFHHITGPAGTAQQHYIDFAMKFPELNLKTPSGYGAGADWYFVYNHDGDAITYEFDRDLFLEDLKKRWKPDSSSQAFHEADINAFMDLMSSYDVQIDIPRQTLVGSNGDSITRLSNYSVVFNPDQTAECIVPTCEGSKSMRDGDWENTCQNPLMIR